MTKRNIITTLLSLGSERGLANVSLSELARACSISKAALYHHFASREELISELFSYAKKYASEQMSTINLTGSATEVLTEAMDHWHHLYSEEPLRSFYRIIHSEALFDREAAAIQQSQRAMIKAQSSLLLESLSSTGRLAIGDLEFAVLTFSSTAQHLLERLLSEDPASIAWEEDQFINGFCSLYRPTLTSS